MVKQVGISVLETPTFLMVVIKMRMIKRIVIHCSATPETMDCKAKDIDRWHKAKGWKGIGYHYVIDRDGTVELGRPESEVGAHAQGYNGNSVGICLVGGIAAVNKLPVCNFTKAQWASLEKLTEELQVKYGIPDSGVCGHNELPNVHKACPCFSVQKWLKLGKVALS